MRAGSGSHVRHNDVAVRDWNALTNSDCFRARRGTRVLLRSTRLLTLTNCSRSERGEDEHASDECFHVAIPLDRIV